MTAVINEFVFNHAGTDTNEYIEVFASAGDTAPAGGYTLLVLEGDGTAAGVIDNVIAVGAPDAAGLSTTPFLANAIENGTLTVLLVGGFSGAAGNDLDTNNDGVLDATPWTTIADSVAVSDGGTDDRAYSTTVLTSANIGAGFTPGGASRVPNGTDTDSAADWRLNDFDLAGIPGFTGTLVPPEVANTPGASNGGATAAPGITVSPATADVAEGGATDSFTVVLNTQPTADVVIAISGNADATVDAPTLTFTAANWNVAQAVTVTAVDDDLVEGTHAATITTAAATSGDATYNGLNAADVAVTITDNDVSTTITPIAEIQGASHASPKLGLSVITTGIVVARDTSGSATNGQRGFYIMDPTGDGDDATSEGLFVAVPGTGALPSVGDALTVTGTVSEFLPGGAATNLSITRLEGASWTVDSTGNALPQGATIGAGGRLPPSTIAQDDDFTSFDITTDGVDFYESLEGMLVTVTNTKVTGPSNGFGETWVHTQDQVDAGPFTERGGLQLSEFDINPERIQLQTDTGVTPGISLSADVADTLGTVTGVLRYDFQNFELVLTQQPIVTDGGLVREETSLAGGADTLLIAAYNAENLDFLDPASRFSDLADTIINTLNRPDIIGLEEIQDNDGAANSGNPDATQTLQRLVQAIIDAGGPAYEIININPENNEDGGQPGGNIRTVFLYNPNRVDYVDGSAFRITDPAAPGGGQDGAFESSRKPLVADFLFQGQQITVVNNHWTSKSGSTGPFSADFPPVNLGEAQRLAQAVLVKDFVEAELAANATAKVAVIGDLNEFEWLPALEELTGGPIQILFNLKDELLPENQRYGYNFEGQAQSLDHIFVTAGLLPGAAVDVVHINSEFAVQQSDHDPSVATFEFNAQAFPNGISSGDVDQDSAVLWALVSARGTATFSWTGTDGSSGSTTIDVTASNVPVKIIADGLTAGTDYTYTVTDSLGRSLEGEFSTSAQLGEHAGFRFGVSGDWRGELLPYPAISNADEANLDLFVKLGDTIYADYASPAVPAAQATTIGEYRAKHAEVYSDDFWQDLQAVTPILATIDDHEVINDFSGGQNAADDPRVGSTTGLVNDSPLYETGLQAFGEYNAIEDRRTGATGDARTADEIDLYRYNTYGSDAAVIVLDARSFRDAPIADWNGTPADAVRFLTESATLDRTMLGDNQQLRLFADLLDAEAKGITWKFVHVPEPIQNFGPLAAADRFEGYARERAEILAFIDAADIENVVFVAADVHGTVVNNLTYQAAPGGPQIALNSFEVTTGSVAFDPPFAPAAINFAAVAGLLTPEQFAFYNALPVAGDADSLVNDKDDFFKSLIDTQLAAFGYDPVGLNTNLAQANGRIGATLTQGDYVAAHTFGWTQFDVDAATQDLTVTTYGLLPSVDAADPTATPGIVSQFVVQAARAIELELWGGNVFPGAAPTRAPDFSWRNKATELHYTDATVTGVQLASALTDTATGADTDRFLSTAGDVAISRLDFAGAASRGTAGGAPQVTLDWLTTDSALVRSDAAWGSLKGLKIDDYTGAALRVEGFVDMHLALSETTRDLTVVADGLRRGTIETGAGDDSIRVGFDSVDTTWGNTAVVRAGAGDDMIMVGASARNYVSGLWSLAGSSTIVTGGAGDDTLVGAVSRDTAVFTGNAAAYTIAVDAGITTVIGADGADTITNFEFLRFADTTLAFNGGVWA